MFCLVFSFVLFPPLFSIMGQSSVTLCFVLFSPLFSLMGQSSVTLCFVSEFRRLTRCCSLVASAPTADQHSNVVPRWLSGVR